ncbi:hypothetical protein B0T20DRAFT_396711 [Sordaria brevicollis]|uniref:Uncharacterized protein n=1 Tax=Sordaria brevicollis TaxID=83679 RepID=A0AAE0P2Q3_SORBR|nr:hypothetical protein B0T20DRAFT_396711 [Sordaria brevicollis]
MSKGEEVEYCLKEWRGMDRVEKVGATSGVTIPVVEALSAGFGMSRTLLRKLPWIGNRIAGKVAEVGLLGALCPHFRLLLEELHARIRYYCCPAKRILDEHNRDNAGDAFQKGARAVPDTGSNLDRLYFAGNIGLSLVCPRPNRDMLERAPWYRPKGIDGPTTPHPRAAASSPVNHCLAVRYCLCIRDLLHRINATLSTRQKPSIMTSHEPSPESCGCFWLHGQRVVPSTCQNCAGSMRQWCGSCDQGMVYRQCPHGPHATSSFPLNGAAPGGSGSNGGFRDGHCGQTGGGWAPTSHGHRRTA